MELFDADTRPAKKAKLSGFKVNKDFAEAFDKRKRAEELSKLHDKYGSGAEEDDDSSTDYSSEDSEAELATPSVDAAILKTLAKIRKGDASIYEAGRNIFDEEEQLLPPGPQIATNGKLKKSKAPLSLSAYQRQTLLAGGAPDDEGNSSVPLPPARAAESLRQETTAAFHQAASSDEEIDEEHDQFLVPRLKTRGEEELEQEEYAAFLRQQAGPDALDLGEGEEFLRDYIMNRGWLEKGTKHIPTQEEILGDDHKPLAKSRKAPSAHVYEPLVEDDEAFEERAEDFEHRYNFRFEESGGDSIVTHAREVQDSVRRPDLARKEKRKKVAEEKAKRKEERLREKAEARAERDRLRVLQADAKDERMAKLREAVGAGVHGLEDMDLDSDFDPAEHDRRMARMFDKAFYDDTAVDAEGKPVFDDSDTEEPRMPYMEGGVDDAYDPSAPQVKETKKDRKKRLKQEAAQIAIETTEDMAEDDDAYKKQYDAYFDRFQVDTLIDDEPTMFRYADVQATAFELTPEEILLATDAELNTYVGLSKLHTYRNVDLHRKRSRRAKELRSVLRKRAWGKEVGQEDIAEANAFLQRSRQHKTGPTGANATAVKPKKRKGKKERERQAQKGVASALDDA